MLSFVVLTYNQIPDTDTRAKNNANPEHRCILLRYIEKLVLTMRVLTYDQIPLAPANHLAVVLAQRQDPGHQTLKINIEKIYIYIRSYSMSRK